MKYKQNKTIKLVLTLILLLSLSVTPFTVSYAGEPAENNVNTGLNEEQQFAIAASAFDPDRLANLDVSRELYIKLIDSISQEPVPDASDYPDWYGGCFMNDKGKLVIYVTPDYSEGELLLKVKNEVINIVDSDDILFEPCEYSFRYLTETMDDLNSTIAKESAVADNFDSYSINDKENRVVIFQKAGIESLKTDASAIKFMNNAYDKGCIVFAESKGPIVEQVNINPGSGIETYAGSGSMAYRARLNGVNGIVTAGHVATSTQTAYNWVDYSGNEVALCTKRQYSGSADVAFCKIVGSNTPTNTIMGGTLLTSTLNPAWGDVVYKRGAAGGTTSGTVTSTNSSGGGFTNLSQASYYSVDGDSGGLVFTFNMSTNTGYTVGIHYGLGDGEAVYTKASVDNAAIGITRY